MQIMKSPTRLNAKSRKRKFRRNNKTYKGGIV